MSDGFLLWGGYGGHNLGDEAILWAMSKLLRRLKPDFKQSVLIRGEISEPVAKQYRRWDISPVRFGSLASLKLLCQFRLIVGGGQLLDNTLSLWPVGWTSLMLVANAISGQRPLILCIGAEPVTRTFIAFVARTCYSLAEVCSCRDPESVAAVKKLGVPPEKVVATRDVVFSLDRTVLPAWRLGTGGLPRVTLVLAHDPQRTPQKAHFFSELTLAIAHAGCDVRLVAHDLRLEYDYGLLLDLECQFENNPRVTIWRPTVVEDVLQEYSRSDAVVSTRMHPLILASLVRALPIAVSGTAKVQSLIRNLGLPALDRLETPDVIAANILSFLATKDSYLQTIDSRIAQFASVVETTTAQALVG